MTAEEISQLYEDLKAQYARRDVVGRRLRKVLTNNYQDEIGFLDLALPGQEPLVANLVGAAARITAQRVGRYPRISVIPAHRSQLDKDVRKTEAMELQLREDLERTGFRATLAQAALWMVSHGVLPLVVRPSVQYGSPVIEVRDPLTLYVDTVWPHRPEVSSALYVESMAASRAEQLYPGASASLGEDVTEVLIGEYFSPEGITVVGPLGGGHADILADYPSILPFVCSVCRLTADRPVCPNCGRSIAKPLMTVVGRGFSSDLSFEGQFESTIPLLIAQAKMFGLMMAYMEQNVYPETNIFAELQSNNAQYAIGPGAVNYFNAGPGARVEKSANEMSPQVFNELDRFERAIRIAGGFPAQMSGEPVATIATGKGIEELTATVDDNVNYWQTVVQDTLIKAMNLFSDTSIAFGGEGSGLYLPRSSYRVGVRHLSSSDPAQLVGMLQQVDSKLVSRATVRAKLDSVDQPEIEEVSIETEQLRDALLQGVLQRSAMPVAQGGMDPKDVARLIHMRREGAALEDAVERLAAEAQQASPATGAAPAPASISQLLQKAAGGGQGGQPPAVMTPGGARSLERQMSIPPQQFTLNQQGAENSPPYAGRPPTLPSARTLPNV